MGGAVHHPGNITPAAEANIGNDPEVAQTVLAAGWDLTIVPLDATMRENLTEDLRRKLLAHPSPISRFAGAALDFYCSFYEGNVLPFRGAPCHDALAAGIAIGEVLPRLAPRLHVTVDTGDGPARGALIADTRGHCLGYPERDDANAQVVFQTDQTFSLRLTERLCQDASQSASSTAQSIS